MEWNENNIEQIVEFINAELLKGRTMKEIESNEFGENERVISKRLIRKGYVKINNQFVTKEELGQLTKLDDAKIEQHKIEIDKQMKELMLGASQKSIKQKHNQSIKMDKLEELISLIEPIKEVIAEYNKSKSFVEVEPVVELKPKNITEVKQKLFKVDVEVLEKWEQFVVEHKQFKVQNLISLCLEEFIDKYK